MNPPMTVPGKDAWELLDRLDRLGDSVPLDETEADDLLKEIHVDAAAELKRSMDLVARAKARAVQETFARARQEREKAAAALARPRPRRSRLENLAIIEHIAALLPAGRELVVQHRDFESAPDEDVDSLAAELETLLEADRGAR